MRIWFISDTHGAHRDLDVPDVDMVIHCGDESNNRNPHQNHPHAFEFFRWYRNLPIKHKVYVPGNHSTAVWFGLIDPGDFPEIKFLIHQFAEIGGLKIFGSPYTPTFGDWAYMKKRSQMAAVWESIPEEVDVLVTHGPPKGVLDLTTDLTDNRPVQVGCKSLMNAVLSVAPRIHAFGHIHDEDTFLNYGVLKRDLTTFVNCSCMDLKYRLVHNGFILNEDGEMQ